MKASLIIRTKNEERWIASCLESVFNQNYDDFEVILVDNMSEDGTVAKAQQFPVKLVTIERYKPGESINVGIAASSGDVIVILSGHCVPTNNDWLKNLIAPLENKKIAGVYGRQQPMSFTTDRDKRDLLTVFGLDPKIQKKDTFFHNANSAILRSTLEKFPFDEETPHIEDRLWAHDVLAAGMEIYYEPAASVYHYHGIHQDDNPKRRRNVVQILEGLAEGKDSVSLKESEHPSAPNPKELNTIALIPVRGDLTQAGSQPLLKYTLDQAKKSHFIDRVFVLTDNAQTAEYAKQNGAEAPFLRPRELSREFVDIAEVLKFGVEELAQWDVFPDICVVLKETYPFRPSGFIDDMIVQLLREGTDCAIAVKEEFRSIWVDRGKELENISPLIPRKLKKENFYISLFGLGFVTYPSYIRNTTLGMEKPHKVVVNDPLATLEVREDQKKSYIEGLLNLWDSSL